MRNSNGHSLAELAIVCLMLFFLAVFPLIDLLGVAVSAAGLMLLAHQTASSAASRQKFDEALSAVNEECTSFLSNGFAKFMRMKPVAGYKQCGTDLYINVTDFHTGLTTLVGPNKPLPSAPDALTNVYEYTAKSTYEVGPLISLGSIYLLDQIPGLGKPATLTFSASRAVEHLNGMLVNTPAPSLSGGGASLSLGGGGAPGSTDPTGGDWNNPSIYQMIADKGQTVVTSDVLIVNANNEGWTISKAQAFPGERVWLDTRADGVWRSGPSGSQVSADGFTAANGFTPVNVAGLPAGALIGKVGANGTQYYSGKAQLNFVPPPADSGFVQFRFNDYPGQYMDNTGQMIVRVIVTR